MRDSHFRTASASDSATSHPRWSRDLRREKKPAGRLKSWRMAFPSLVTALRLLLLPLIWSLWSRGQVEFAIGLYGLAVLSDWADGRLARSLGATSAFGAFFDVISDIAFLVALLVLLGRSAVVPTWLFLAPLSAAVGFFLTSGRAAPRYDPLGKYFGSILFLVVGCLLLNLPSTACTALCCFVVILSGIVTVNRWRIGCTRWTA